ncbi:MmgE/PrpD family protein [Devosia sp. 1566]|uniref:MmgE/PrpD family protein n=1 Tax=Devosia sp. 1566 TaxID=2499144 RepID=UPI000FDB9AD2|nr:MmgE/PrpD family protein [Devosia sp. 1566]
MPNLSSQLAEWTVGFSLDDAPAEVVHNTKLRIVDLVGVMLASHRLRPVEAARRAQQDADGGGRGAQTLGDATETSLAGAAFINGVASAVLEFDDTHIASNIHPTGVILAAALAEAHKTPQTGRQLLEAVLVGSEILCRLGLVSPVRMHEVGFHPTSVYGVFGAAYAVARLRGLLVGVMADAVGTAASLSAGSISAFQDGADSKTLHVGFAAAAGIRAVALAQQGLTGPSAVFEGNFGWYKSHVQSDVQFRFDTLVEGLGSRWEVLNIAPKLYPCAYTMMPFITAALELRAQHDFALEDIAEIRCEIMRRSFRTVCEPVEDKRRPRTSWHGRISLQHTVAEALALGRFNKSSYSTESLGNPVINALADKVVHVADPLADADTSRSRAVVTLVMADGRSLTHTVEDMVGTRRNPAPDSVYFAKFHANVDDVIGADRANALLASLLRLERADDINDLFAKLKA